MPDDTYSPDLEPGQTEQHDPLRLHLLAEHRNHAALGLTDAETLAGHEHEHQGPGTIRDHDPASTTWSFTKAMDMVVDEDDDSESVRLWNAHCQRGAGMRS